MQRNGPVADRGGLMIWFASYVLAGAFVGVLAGLLGIGGGMTLVPVMAALFAAQHFAPDHVVHMALATCMASIVFTSSSSVREHLKFDGVNFNIVKRMTPGLVAGSLFATSISAWIPQRHLALSFSVIVFFGATQILLNRKPKAARTLPSAWPLFFIGLMIGIIGGLVSAGGAFLTIPFMLWCGVPMKKTIGTGAMMGIPLAVVGTIGYVISGWSVPGLPSDAVGFISVTALIGIVCGSVVTAPFGARLAHRLPVPILKRIFACLLYVLAAKMLWTYW
ncbi:MAG TPA: sulfite exporter TauE/SafE family protein [Oxalicibacterium sp.]|uniref:sulfite exporter TauE/SafE family protein n=1 Tax=Oxalicibacterium sp. TaxID=2766525 RepID=UPI002B96178C|nr:sulfite exporter TauE/SafE family protein [Oxalicibacterium sp.]HWU99034.1 sulfite exporter TauE/SafE family protein [Oxalicibacterium sp.]